MFDYQKIINIKQSFPVKVYYAKTFKIKSFGVSEGGNENLFFENLLSPYSIYRIYRYSIYHFLLLQGPSSKYSINRILNYGGAIFYVHVIFFSRGIETVPYSIYFRIVILCALIESSFLCDKSLTKTVDSITKRQNLRCKAVGSILLTGKNLSGLESRASPRGKMWESKNKPKKQNTNTSSSKNAHFGLMIDGSVCCA